LGNAMFAGSSSSPLLQQVTANTVTTLTSSANPSSIGQEVTFKAAVAAQPGAGALNGGIVNFYVDGILQSVVTVDRKGVAILALGDLSVGSHTVTAFFSGNAAFNASSMSIAQLVQPLATGLAVSLSQGSNHGSTMSVNTPFAITVTAFDQQGHNATNLNGQPAQLIVLSSPSGGSLTGPLNVQFVHGIARFSGLIATAAGEYMVRAFDPVDGLFLDFTFIASGRQT
jgi:Bacterial Ig-like domain (group 3)